MRPVSLTNFPAHARMSSAASSHAESASDRANAAMDRYARGDDCSFGAVYDEIAPRVHAYLLRQTGDRARADDLLQQTLLQIHRYRGTYASGLAVLPWAFGIARRLSIDEFKRRKADALSSARALLDADQLVESLPDAEVATREVVERVEAELANMPENQRVAFELLRFDGLTHLEAAQVLGTTVSAIKLRAFRAARAIRAVLSRNLDSSDASDVTE